LANLTGNLTINQISAITETAGFNSNIYLNDHTLTLNGNNKLLLINHNYHHFLLRFIGVGTSVVNGFYFKRIVNGYNFTMAFIITANVNGQYTLYIYNCVLDSNNLIGNCLYSSISTVPTMIYNNILCNATYGVYIASIHPSSIIENNAIFNCNTVGININNRNLTLINNAVFNNITNFINIGFATGNNNASSDATGADSDWSSGSDNKTNLVAVDEFKSLVNTDPDFLLPIKDKNLDGTGTNPLITGHTKYFNNIKIVLSDVDIGAKGVKGGATSYFFKLW